MYYINNIKDVRKVFLHRLASLTGSFSQKQKMLLRNPSLRFLTENFINMNETGDREKQLLLQSSRQGGTNRETDERNEMGGGGAGNAKACQSKGGLATEQSCQPIRGPLPLPDTNRSQITNSICGTRLHGHHIHRQNHLRQGLFPSDCLHSCHLRPSPIGQNIPACSEAETRRGTFRKPPNRGRNPPPPPSYVSRRLVLPPRLLPRIATNLAVIDRKRRARTRLF